MADLLKVKMKLHLINNSNNNSDYWNDASTSNMEEWGFAR